MLIVALTIIVGFATFTGWHLRGIFADLEHERRFFDEDCRHG